MKTVLMLMCLAALAFAGCVTTGSVPAGEMAGDGGSEVAVLVNCGESAVASQSSSILSDAEGLLADPSKATLVSDLEALASKAGPQAVGCALTTAFKVQTAPQIYDVHTNAVAVSKQQVIQHFLDKHHLVLKTS